VTTAVRQRGIPRALKVFFDRTVAALGLVAISPLMAVVAASIRVRMGSPVLFVQERPGLGARVFRLLKFRTMRSATAADGASLADSERLTRLGHFLRSTSLDELPQLWNVLRGDLSLVGPRPLLVQYLQRYTPEQARRHDVLPGITGWAQVNGRNAISWDEKFELDLWYVDHWTLGLDMRILGRTLVRVLKRDGIAQADHVTMPEFLGTHPDTNGTRRA
jgi:lipopolysaccharide/colanic/teichoic acid biosynthesis glycosyltransferase